MTTQSVFKSPDGEKLVMDTYNSHLARWTFPIETHMVDTRHGETFVITSGDESAPSLVLLHGAGTNSMFWESDIAEYRKTYRVYAIDLLGEAGKTAPNRPSWENLAYSEWLEDTLDALKVEQAILLGTSQGGWTALKFATNHPERVSKLILLSPGGVVPDQMGFFIRLGIFSLLGNWGINRSMKMLFANQTVPEEALKTTAIYLKHFKARIGTLPIYTNEELSRLTMPTLLVMGEQDGMRNKDKIATRLQSYLPHLSVKTIPNGGHALINMQPHIMPFLQETNT